MKSHEKLELKEVFKSDVESHEHMFILTNFDGGSDLMAVYLCSCKHTMAQNSPA